MIRPAGTLLSEAETPDTGAMPDIKLRRHLPAWAVVAVTLIALAVVFSLPPIPQDPAYHAFADRTALLAVPTVVRSVCEYVADKLGSALL